MSLLFSQGNELLFLCHKTYIEQLYGSVLAANKNSCPIFKFFCVNHAFYKSNQVIGRKRKRDNCVDNFSSEVLFIKNSYETLNALLNNELFFNDYKDDDVFNSYARKAADFYFSSIVPLNGISGGVNGSNIEISNINDQDYLLPPNCRFFCCDVVDLKTKLAGEKFDFVLIDPPWVNRFVKRRKKWSPHHGYCLTSNDQLLTYGFESLLNPHGMIAVWTTNSPSHISFVKETLFPSCNLKYAATWYWIKVSTTGELVCPISGGSGNKQPFERLIFGVRDGFEGTPIKENVIFMSVPSAVHSHKPPLIDILKKYLKKEAKCLEVFARYLLPGWTSCGNQVLSMQLLSLYNQPPPPHVKEDPAESPK